MKGGLSVLVAIVLVSIFASLATINYIDSFAQDDSGSTFTSKGMIDSTTISNGTEEFLLGGEWNLGVVNGKPIDFNADFTMVRMNGTDRHTMNLMHFRANDNSTVVLSDDGSTTMNGIIDIMGHGHLLWMNVTSQISLNGYNTIIITVDNEQTEDHFPNGIHGIVESLIPGFISSQSTHKVW
jgi:hypothetical protein